jgi:tetratricopeptide (TPR) repeat protein
VTQPLNPLDIPEPIREEALRLALSLGRAFVEKLLVFRKRLKEDSRKNFDRALTLWQQGHLDEAIKCFRRCPEKEMTTEGRAIVHNLISAVLRDLCRFRESEAEASTALDYALAAKSAFLEAAALDSRGIARCCGGYAAIGIADLNRSIATSKQAKDAFGQAVTLSNLAAAYHGAGNFPDAKRAARKGYRMAQALKDDRLKASTAGNLANALRDSNELDEALSKYKQSLRLARENGLTEFQGLAVGNIGTVHRLRGEIDEAQKCFDESLALHRETSSKLQEANQLGNLAGVADARGDYAQALKLYQKALAMHGAVGANMQLYQDHMNIARVFMKLRNPKATERHLTNALAIARSLRGQL